MKRVLFDCCFSAMGASSMIQRVEPSPSVWMTLPPPRLLNGMTMARRGFCVADGGQKNQETGCTEYNRKHQMDSRRKNEATSRGRCPCVRNENRSGRRRGAAATLNAVIHHSSLRHTCTLELLRESTDAHQWYWHGWMPPFRGRSNSTHLDRTTLVTVSLSFMACRNW